MKKQIKKKIITHAQHKKEWYNKIKKNLNDIGILMDMNNEMCICRLVGFFEDMHDWGRVYKTSKNELIDTIGFEHFINLKSLLSPDVYQRLEFEFEDLGVTKVKKLVIVKH